MACNTTSRRSSLGPITLFLSVKGEVDANTQGRGVCRQCAQGSQAFPVDARRAAGFQLDLLQQGAESFDWRPMKTVGRGVNEIRITEASGAFRIFYVVNRPEAIYVLHAIHKTTRKTEPEISNWHVPDIRK